MPSSMMHLLLLVPVVAFQHETSQRLGEEPVPEGKEGDPPTAEEKAEAADSDVLDKLQESIAKQFTTPKTRAQIRHLEQHIQQCQSLDLTLPSYSNFDAIEHDCDVSTLAMDTVAADEVMDMNELTCQTFCGKVNHGDCQCDEEECDKNDKDKGGKTIRDGATCKDANSAHAGEACKVDYECTMNGPMSFCTEAPETIDVVLCSPTVTLSPTGGRKQANGAEACNKLDHTNDEKLSEFDDREYDCDVKSSATDLAKADAKLDALEGTDPTSFCGKVENGNFQCKENLCDAMDFPEKCDKPDDAIECVRDYECTTLGPLSYCTEVDKESSAPTVDVKICGFV